MEYSFFAYGSFSKGQVHFAKFVNFIKSEKQAFVKGHIYRLRCGYPLLVPCEEGGWVEGTLYQLNVPESFWPIVDELLGFSLQTPEKSLVQRLEVPIKVDNFSQTKAFVYTLNPKKIVSAYKKITDCNWIKNLQQHPPVVEQLQDRQKEYIKKLSLSRGRDIVPIKLDLYRELMGLEFVVDKGRRLALTPLGKEAVLFTR